MESKQVKIYRMSNILSATGVGAAVTSAFSPLDSKSEMVKKPGLVYDLLKLEWLTFNLLAGVGYGFAWSWGLSRSSTFSLIDDYIVDYKKQDGLYLQYSRHSDTPSLAYNHVDLYVEGGISSYDFCGIPQTVLRSPEGLAAFRVLVDTLGGRNWAMMIQLKIHYVEREVSRDQYQKLERAYGLRGGI